MASPFSVATIPQLKQPFSEDPQERAVINPNVENAAQRDGIGISTMRRARFDLGVVSTKQSISGAWNWALPETKSTG